MAQDFSSQEIANRLAILDIYARYVFAVDDSDFDELDKLFTPDSTIDWTSAGAIKVDYKTAKEIISNNNKNYISFCHMTTNHRIKFNDDQTSAKVKSKTFHPVLMADKDGNITITQVLGGYEDDLIKTPEGWRIKARVWFNNWASYGQNLLDDKDKPMDVGEH